MTLPEGRKPLTDQDMINLLHSIAGNFNSWDERKNQVQQTADRFSELSKGKNDEQRKR
jgi:hypothetical protein